VWKRTWFLLVVFLCVLLFVAEGISPGFVRLRHLGVVLRQASFLGIVGLGQTLVILTGGIDLSVGALVTAGNIFTCELLARSPYLPPLVLLLPLLVVGFLVGVGNGLGITRLGIPPLIMTVATGSIVDGVTLIYCGGSSAGYATPPLQYLGSRLLAGVVPVNSLIFVTLCAGVAFLLNRTTFGRKVFAVGTNEVAAYASGVNTSRVKVMAYGLSALLAVFMGMILAGYTQTGFLGIGNEYTLSSIAATVIGGTSITGGRGGILGTALGAIILTVIKSILTVLQIPESGRKIVEGLVILTLVNVYARGR
jgi:ribose transport system permease protein